MLPLPISELNFNIFWTLYKEIRQIKSPFVIAIRHEGAIEEFRGSEVGPEPEDEEDGIEVYETENAKQKIENLAELFEEYDIDPS